MDYGYLSLSVPLVVVIAAVLTREVVLSLFLGVIAWQGVKLGYFAPFETVYLSFESIVSLFAKGWVVKSIIFIVLVGSILTLVVKSGGVDALVTYLVQRSERIKSKRAALLMGYIIGIVIFIESTITSLVVGAVTTPVAEKFGASRAKVAYICDSTSAPVCSLIPLNGWGALMTGLVGAQIASGVIAGDAVGIVANSIVYNFYSILTLLFVLYIIVFDKDFSYMKQSELAAQKHIKTEQTHANDGAKIVFILLPITLLTISSIAFLVISGGGDIMKGSGTSAVFYAVIATLVFCFVYFVLWHKRFGVDEYFSHLKTGAFDMAYIGVMMILAFAIGEATKELGTGAYLASMVSDFTSPSYIAAIVFFAASVISFSTGTSWGTFSVMIPIGIQLGVPMGVDPALMVGAAVAGGVFGDHCSPISDTTIVSAAAAGCDAMEHIKTQLPYAVTVALISLVCYLIVGLLG
jgi:Na+/H+ antiporter NhaC